MCTAISFKTKKHYFGRNLDYEYSYEETVTITPRNYPFKFVNGEKTNRHYAMIGMAFVQQFPLYYDATNEKGLSIAGLNFPQYAHYNATCEKLINVAPFEFIPYILCDCATVQEALKKLKKMNIIKRDFSDSLPVSPLHWIISDSAESVVAEPLKDGFKIYENPVGALTNSPPFDYQLLNLANYMNITRNEPTDRFSDKVVLTPYSRGMGAMGLPGDLSSSSRFVRAAFTKLNSVCGDGEEESVSQFFHILGSVAQQKGCCKVEKGYEYTIYSSCCNTDDCIYYYTTYDNPQIYGVDMKRENLDSAELINYPLKKGKLIIQN